MRGLFVKVLLGVIVGLVPLLSGAAPGKVKASEGVQQPTQPVHASTSAPTDAEELESYFDSIIPSQLDTYHIPGATITVVKDGELLFAKGYGYANLEKQTPFDPNTSLVRIASITKLFTWTAVMQLVEQGKLDLHADVNEYLTTFQVPDTFPQPITLVHLMTHTAGFEDRTIGLAARTPQDVPPLGEYLAQHLPARVRPPGEIAAYSNHGAGLAGYIVSEVAGMPYEQYVQENILDPLKMEQTTAWEPLPEHLLPDLAMSYTYRDDDAGFEAEPFMYDMMPPDGSISASATDMARFMIAHLQDGRYEDAQILLPATAQLMRRQSFTHHPQMDGWALGFQEFTFNGRRAYGHDGSWEAFQSILLLLPEENLGLFLSYNSPGGIDAGIELIQAFFDRYFPASDAPTESPAAALIPAPAASDLGGYYRLARSSRTTIEKVVTLVESARLTVHEDGTLRFLGRNWEPVEPLLYRDANGNDLLAFLPNERGEIVYAAMNRVAFEKVPWHETIRFNLLLLAVLLGVFLSALIGWPLGAFLRGRRKPGGELASVGPRLARWIAALGVLSALVFLVSLIVILLGDTSEYVYGVPLNFRLLLVLPLLAAGSTLLSLGAMVQAWRRRYWGIWGRVHYTVVVVGLVVTLWFLNTWNMLGFHLG